VHLETMICIKSIGNVMRFCQHVSNDLLRYNYLQCYSKD
jgi:hypothetical protein